MITTCRLRARWLFPVDAPPLERGTLTIAGHRILAVAPAETAEVDIDLGNVAVLPGLVNAHTHLDLSALRGQPLPREFIDWLRSVVAYRRRATPSEWQTAIVAGMAASVASGTTLVGDISAGGLSSPLLAGSPLRAVVFHELIGLTKSRARETLAQASAWLQSQPESPRCRYGLSPHAPYSVRRGLWRWAGRAGVPLAVHWLETREEIQLLQDRGGPLRHFLEQIGAWEEHGLPPSHQWIECQIGNAPRTMFIHGNFIANVPAHSVVYCPRTHAYFGRAEHPFRSLLAAGVNVALGTDSLASNPDLSIFEEMRFLWQRYGKHLGGEQLLKMGTLNGAVALGWQQETGSLTPGKSADWIAVPLDDCDSADPYELLFSSRQPIRYVVVGGEWLVRDGKTQSRLQPFRTTSG
jgi:cytosine/adenosine deaminase-related metal-dependent hydrolase